MRWVRIIVFWAILQTLCCVGISYAAGSSISIEVIAMGNVTTYCPTQLTATLAAPYQVSLTWVSATGNDSLGTMIRADYGAYPTNPTNGELVYEGNGTAFTHILEDSWGNMSAITGDIYYRAWNAYGNATYSVCYASAMVELPELPGGGMPDMTDIAHILLIFQYLGFPSLLIVICFSKRNIVAFIAAIMSIGLVLGPIDDAFGTYLVVPLILLMVGFGVMFLSDAWERRVEL